jgi:antitoxin CptB
MGQGTDGDEARLRWRCRRGLKELDLLLDRYLTERWPAAPAAQRSECARLLERENPDLAALISGISAPGNPEEASLIARLRAGPGRADC